MPDATERLALIHNLAVEILGVVNQLDTPTPLSASLRKLGAELLAMDANDDQVLDRPAAVGRQRAHLRVIDGGMVQT